MLKVQVEYVKCKINFKHDTFMQFTVVYLAFFKTVKICRFYEVIITTFLKYTNIFLEILIQDKYLPQFKLVINCVVTSLCQGNVKVNIFT